MNPYVMSYTLYELERGIEEHRRRSADAAAGHYGSALDDLTGLARKIVAAASKRSAAAPKRSAD
jgi:hypothetical protein